METKCGNRKQRAQTKDVRGIVYKIYCKTTKKYYIGQTLSHKYCKADNQWDASGIKSRWSAHIREMGKNNKTDLYVDMNKYGLDDFVLKEIERYSGRDIFLLAEYEEKYILEYNALIPNGYNKVLSQPFDGVSRRILLDYYNSILDTPIDIEKINQKHAQKIIDNDKARRRAKGKPRIKKPKFVYTTDITSKGLKYDQELRNLLSINNIYKIYSSVIFSKKRKRYIYCLNIKHENGITQYKFSKMFITLKTYIEKTYRLALDLATDLCREKGITNEISEYIIYGEEYKHFECVINDSPEVNQYSKYSIDNIEERSIEDYRYKDNLLQLKDKNIYRIYSLVSNHKKRGMMTYTVIVVNDEKEKSLSFGGKTIDMSTAYNLAIDFVRRLCALKNIPDNIEEFEAKSAAGTFKQFKYIIREKEKEGYEYQDRLDFFKDAEILRFFSRRTRNNKKNFFYYVVTIHFITEKRNIKVYSFGGQAMPEEQAYDKALIYAKNLLNNKEIEDNIKETQEANGKKFTWDK